MKNQRWLGIIILSLAVVLVIGLVIAAHTDRSVTDLLSELQEFASRYGADKPGPGAPANPGVGMNQLPGLPQYASRYGSGGPPSAPPRPGIS